MLLLPESDTAERERILLAEALAGRTTVDWLDDPDGVRLGLVRWSDGVAYGVSCRLNQWLADIHGARLPTAWRADWCWRHAERQYLPIIKSSAIIGLTSTMIAVSELHNRLLVPGFGDSKCWVLDAKCWAPGLRACNHGYWIPQGDVIESGGAATWHGIRVYYRPPIDAYVIQDRGSAHDVNHADSSQWPWIVIAPDSDYADLPGDRHPIAPWHPAVRLGVDAMRREVDTRTTYPTLRIGTVGEPVRRWQCILVDDALSVAVDGVYGPLTQSATAIWQRRRGLGVDGVVGPKTWAASLVPAPPDTVPTPPPSAVGGIIDRIKLVQAHPANYRRGRPGAADLIMLHTAECKESITAAEQLAEWCRRAKIGDYGASWTYAVDADSIVQCLREEDTAWACPGFNGRTIHIELAGYARQGKTGWEDDYSRAVIRNTVELVRWILSRRPHIPAVRLGWSDLLGEAPGICGHVDGSRALREAQALGLRREPWYGPKGWRTSTHTDPGPDFKWVEFMSAVRA